MAQYLNMNCLNNNKETKNLTLEFRIETIKIEIFTRFQFRFGQLFDSHKQHLNQQYELLK